MRFGNKLHKSRQEALRVYSCVMIAFQTFQLNDNLMSPNASACASDAPGRTGSALPSPAARLGGGRGGRRGDQQQLCSTSHESHERGEQLKCLKALRCVIRRLWFCHCCFTRYLWFSVCPDVLMIS